MTDKTYGGWSTYETWLLYTWLTNDPEGCDMLDEIISEHADDYAAAHGLEDLIEEQSPIAETSGLYFDLLKSALDEVNWQEIIESVRTDDDTLDTEEGC